MIKYSRDIETKMIKHFHSLSEKDKHHYAAVEALKLSYGGRRYNLQLIQY